MQKEYIAQGNSVEEAIELGCEKLGLDSFEVTTEVLELPKKGFFGKIKVPAKVKLTYDDGVKEEPKVETKIEESKTTVEVKEEKKVVDPGDKEKKIQIAKDYMLSIFKGMGIDDVQFDVKDNDDGAIISLTGENLGVIIGHRGETLDAIQYLVSLVCNKIDSGYYRITIDCGDFRSKREQTLKELAEKISNSVLKTGRSTTLEPMNPYERRIIHAVISEKEGVISRSIGDEPYRKVIISNPNAKNNYKSRGPRGKGGYNKRGGYNKKPAQKTAPVVDENREKLNDISSDSLYSKIEL